MLPGFRQLPDDVAAQWQGSEPPAYQAQRKKDAQAVDAEQVAVQARRAEAYSKRIGFFAMGLATGLGIALAEAPLTARVIASLAALIIALAVASALLWLRRADLRIRYRDMVLEAQREYERTVLQLDRKIAITDKPEDEKLLPNSEVA